MALSYPELQRMVARRDAAYMLVRSNEERSNRCESRLKDVEAAHVLVQEVSKSVQQQVHARISTLVSKCLAAVFEDPYKFEIVFENRANRTEAQIQFLRGENAVDPLSGAGGGVVDVAAFALRLACLSLTKPPVRKVLVLDEPFRFVSASYRPKVRDLLQSLSDELGVQIIMVTHIEEFRFGNVIELKGNSDVGIESLPE